MSSTEPRRAAVIPADVNSLDKLAAAKFYSESLGWAVHPLMPSDRGDEKERGKKPLLNGWRDHRSSDITPEFLTRNFNCASHSNLGCVVRAPFVHIDLDSKADAGESVGTWLASQPGLATVPRERTGGGAHLVFVCHDLPEGLSKHGKALGNQINDRVSAELFFDGLNIVLSPSIHKSGHQYLWEVTGEIPAVTWSQLVRWFGFKEPESAKRGRPKKDAPWWAQFSGDLSTLDILKLFRGVNRLGDCLDADTDKWAVRCPWDHEHSTQSADIGSDTAVFASEPPGFHCLHAHCAERGMKDLCEWFEQQHPGLVDKHCREQRVWAEGQVDCEGRPRIPLPGLDREDSEFAVEVAEVIAPKRVWFNKANRVVAISLVRYSENAESLGFVPMVPVEARTAVEDHLQTGIVQVDKESSQPQFMVRTMTRECAAGLLAAPQFKRKLPEIIRILNLPLPIHMPDGTIAYPEPGYDPRFRIYTDPTAPLIKPMSADEAMHWIREAHDGFGWRDKQSLVHQLARFITPYCRGLMGWDARFPLWHYSANRPRAGKDYLAGVTHMVYEGHSCEDSALEREGEETRKRITAALMSGRRMMHFANCQGHIQDACFIGAITSKMFAARNLGSTEASADLKLPNEIEFSISANIGLTFRPDVEPRTRRISLMFAGEHANGRTFPKADLHGWLLRHRSEMLSAVAALMQRWIDSGCPKGATPFSSYPEWAAVVGGIMQVNNLGDPCQPHEDDGGLPADRQTEAMKALFAACFRAHPDAWITKGEIYEVIGSHSDEEVFSWFGDLAEKSVKTRIGKDLRQFRGRELGGITLRVDDRVRETQKQKFMFTAARDEHADFAREVLGTPAKPAQEAHSHATDESAPEENSGTDLVFTPSKPDAHSAHSALGSAVSETMGIIHDETKKGNNKVEPIIEAGESVRYTRHVRQTPTLVASSGAFPQIAGVICAAGVVALDLETYGPRKKEGLDPWRGDIRLLSLRVEGRDPFIIDLRATGYDLGELKPALESAQIFAHNAKFDLQWMRLKCGLRLKNVFCTMTASRVLTNGSNLSNGLDDCLERLLNVERGEDHSTSDWGVEHLSEAQLVYSARDVAHLHDLANVLRQELQLQGLTETNDLEQRLLPVVLDMEMAGITVDRERLMAIKAEAHQNARSLDEKARLVLRRPKLNLNSHQQLLEALESAGFQIESTSADVLKEVDDGAIIPVILDYKKKTSLAKQAESLLKEVRADGRVHGSFNATGTKTGRFSASKPNLQNIGRGELRSCFIAEPGHKLVVADYSQIELRVAAAIAGETEMLNAFKDGVDLHSQTAGAVLGISLDAVTKQNRQLAKAVNFGLLFGQSAPGLVDYAAFSYGVKVELKQAEGIRNLFFRAYPGLRQWHDQSWKKAKRGPHEIRTVLGRRRLIPETASEWERFTALVNTPVQGSCADGMKQSIVNLAAKLPHGARMVSTVHDELILEAPEAMAEEVCVLTQAAMIEAMAGLFPEVPIEVEARVCDHWGEK